MGHSFSLSHLLNYKQSLDRNEGKAVKLVIGIRQRNGALLSAVRVSGKIFTCSSTKCCTENGAMDVLYYGIDIILNFGQISQKYHTVETSYRVTGYRVNPDLG